MRRICRYDCGGKQGEIGTSKGRGAFSQLPWTARVLVTCLAQIQWSPKHVRLGLLLFIYPVGSSPSVPPYHFHRCSRRPLVPPFSFYYLHLPWSLISTLLSSRVVCAHPPRIDRCQGRANTLGRTCQRDPMSTVIVIRILIRAHRVTTSVASFGELRILIEPDGPAYSCVRTSNCGVFWNRFELDDGSV